MCVCVCMYMCVSIYVSSIYLQLEEQILLLRDFDELAVLRAYKFE